jgi:hypothetical protein
VTSPRRRRLRRQRAHSRGPPPPKFDPEAMIWFVRE